MSGTAAFPNAAGLRYTGVMKKRAVPSKADAEIETLYLHGEPVLGAARRDGVKTSEEQR
jgi:hypothetical protein